MPNNRITIILLKAIFIVFDLIFCSTSTLCWFCNDVYSSGVRAARELCYRCVTIEAIFGRNRNCIGKHTNVYVRCGQHHISSDQLNILQSYWIIEEEIESEWYRTNDRAKIHNMLDMAKKNTILHRRRTIPAECSKYEYIVYQTFRNDIYQLLVICSLYRAINSVAHRNKKNPIWAECSLVDTCAKLIGSCHLVAVIGLLLLVAAPFTLMSVRLDWVSFQLSFWSLFNPQSKWRFDACWLSAHNVYIIKPNIIAFIHARTVEMAKWLPSYWLMAQAFNLRSTSSNDWKIGARRDRGGWIRNHRDGDRQWKGAMGREGDRKEDKKWQM